MSPETISILIGVATFVCSLGASMVVAARSVFSAGNQWGEVRTDMRVMADRLAKIEGMFTLKLKDPSDGN